MTTFSNLNKPNIKTWNDHSACYSKYNCISKSIKSYASLDVTVAFRSEPPTKLEKMQMFAKFSFASTPAASSSLLVNI